jgi:sigma-E factor negative regulatory protein RseA
MVERERVSALMDGELELDQIPGLERVMKDDDARACWQTYHLIGDVMRGEKPASGQFVARVSAVLAEEPTVLAPKPARPSSAARNRMFALSAAASLAGVALVGWLAFKGGISDPNGSAGDLASDDREVRDYLHAHQEYSPTAGMHGVGAYVRTVAAQ